MQGIRGARVVIEFLETAALPEKWKPTRKTVRLTVAEYRKAGKAERAPVSNFGAGTALRAFARPTHQSVGRAKRSVPAVQIMAAGTRYAPLPALL